MGLFQVGNAWWVRPRFITALRFEQMQFAPDAHELHIDIASSRKEVRGIYLEPPDAKEIGYESLEEFHAALLKAIEGDTDRPMPSRVAIEAIDEFEEERLNGTLGRALG